MDVADNELGRVFQWFKLTLNILAAKVSPREKDAGWTYISPWFGHECRHNLVFDSNTLGYKLEQACVISHPERFSVA